MHEELFYRVTTSLCASTSWNTTLYSIAIGAWLVFAWSILGLWKTNWRVQAYMRWGHIFLSLGVALYPTMIMFLRSVAIDCDDSQTILQLMPIWPAMHMIVKCMAVIALFCGIAFFWKAWRVPVPKFDDPIVDDELAKFYVLSTRKRLGARMTSVFTDQALYMDDAYAQLRDLWESSWANFLDYRSRMDSPSPVNLQELSLMDHSVLRTAIAMHLHRDTSPTDAAAVTEMLVERGLVIAGMEESAIMHDLARESSD